jgi:hypothetical protein
MKGNILLFSYSSSINQFKITISKDLFKYKKKISFCQENYL